MMPKNSVPNVLKAVAIAGIVLAIAEMINILLKVSRL